MNSMEGYISQEAAARGEAVGSTDLDEVDNIFREAAARARQ